MTRWIFKAAFIFALAALTACASAAQPHNGHPTPDVNDYQSCVDAGYPILKSYPPRCAAKGGKIFTQDVLHNIHGRVCKDRCGDGVCEQIVCQAEGCPCAESPENCPKDCAENSF